MRLALALAAAIGLSVSAFAAEQPSTHKGTPSSVQTPASSDAAGSSAELNRMKGAHAAGSSAEVPGTDKADSAKMDEAPTSK